VILAVKEHPSAIALPSIEFYRQLTALPNVVLIGPGANSKQLAKDGLGVICLASTLGFEAAALNKPVICLGDVLFGFFPNVKMIEHYGDLSGAIDWALNYRPLDSQEIVSAMSAYVEFTKLGTFSFRDSSKESSSLDNMANIIADFIGMKKILHNDNIGMSA
jgi:Capsule polysaccharide biosynthesis protein